MDRTRLNGDSCVHRIPHIQEHTPTCCPGRTSTKILFPGLPMVSCLGPILVSRFVLVSLYVLIFTSWGGPCGSGGGSMSERHVDLCPDSLFLLSLQASSKGIDADFQDTSKSIPRPHQMMMGMQMAGISSSFAIHRR